MSNDDDASLGGQATFTGGSKRETNPQSLGDQPTFAGGGRPSAPQSLGDELTRGGAGADDAPFDDDTELVDLSARYTLEGKLGQGGMGEVLLAMDQRLKRKVAIKRVLGEMARSRTAVGRFLTEAQSIAALNHPNIVQIYDYGRDPQGPFLILEYVDGNSLLDRCRTGALPLEEAVELTCQLCDGLGVAHDAGIIHRDIKPANVLLTKSGLPKLTDFGLAKDEAVDSGLSVAGAVLGTLDFMPPEQRRNSAQTDARSDLWSLAATLYQLVTGELPRVIDLEAVPQQLRQTLAKALKTKKEDRYQSAREFREALRACLKDSGPASGDLGEGQCPHCATKNDSSRKFCRSCAGSLEVTCLSCSTGMPMWEEVCGNCGTKQSALLEQRRTQMAVQQRQAGDLLKQLDYPGANKLSTALRDEPDLRLRHLRGWAEGFLKDLESQQSQQQERTGTLWQEARQHEAAYDYPAAIHALEQVPQILRAVVLLGQSVTVDAVLSRLQKLQTDSQKLDQRIRQRLKSQQLTGLLSEVEALLLLRPDRQDLTKLREQLRDRDRKLLQTRDTAFAEGQRLLQAQDYDACLSELAKIDVSLLRPDITALREQAQTRRERLAELRPAILSAVQEKKLHGLLKQVDECLSLKETDPELQKLRERLVERDRKNAAQVAEIVDKARQQQQACQFETASKTLRRIPEAIQTEEVIDLLQTCDLLADLRGQTLSRLQQSLESGELESYQTGLTAAKEYRLALKNEELKDREFELQYQECQQGLQDHEADTERAERQRALMKKLVPIGAAVTVVTLLIGAGLWFRAMQRTNAIAQAVPQKNGEAPKRPPFKEPPVKNVKLIGFGNDLATVLLKAEETLNKNDVEGFVKNMFPSGELRHPDADSRHAVLIQRLQDNPKLIEQMATDIKAMQNLTPQLSDAKDMAEYHLPGTTSVYSRTKPERILRLQLVEGSWRLPDNTMPARRAVAQNLAKPLPPPSPSAAY